MPTNAQPFTSGLKRLCENSKLAGLCSARLQAGTLESGRCPLEGGRYMNQNLVLTQTVKPRLPKLQHRRVAELRSSQAAVAFMLD
jgi:hypothetical protein